MSVFINPQDLPFCKHILLKRDSDNNITCCCSLNDELPCDNVLRHANAHCQFERDDSELDDFVPWWNTASDEMAAERERMRREGY